MRVLIATNDTTFTPSLVAAYAELGWEVVAGVDNLYYQASPYDLIHLHWPEELIGWFDLDSDSLGRLAKALEGWRGKTRILATVHNLLPHRPREHPLDRELYSTVYRAADLVGHFSQFSFDSVNAAFGELGSARQVVHRPHLFSDLMQYDRDRAATRRDLGLADDEFAILAFGAFRAPAELRLLQRAVRLSGTRRKRVIFAGRLPQRPGRVARLLQRADFEIWRRANAVVDRRGFTPDGQTPSLFDAADALFIPRIGAQLNSGLLSLAMTMGTPIIAPRLGVYAEYLQGSGNALYEPSSHRDAGRAIDRSAGADRPSVAAQNARIASSWGWPGILEACLPAVMNAAPSRGPRLEASA